ncbi:L,D-transpeptidase family protein [Commensalibacter oyaizuii]|uniref:L,D-transpeptidase family protein n=1 Tax=Commensalibacter oyaizuii TaxID=3043873 RepID=A0ABT6PZL1_9PROT|nr:L,D-transpeptidase family protein [Commensalibacter sp. TBRC 16381]MDI2090153.1 L,D-transpeptidase family protein [Commensalibacter sp. TBRC 16381]
MLHKHVPIIGCLFVSGCAGSYPQPVMKWQENQQMLLVLSSDWSTNTGILLKFQYRSHHWTMEGAPISVSLGKNGSAWGLGLHPFVHQNPMKVEGDLKSPAGIFALGKSFGYAAQVQYSYPYFSTTADDFCIDNTQSQYYNKIVDRQQIKGNIESLSTEPMRRDLYFKGDSLYKLGIVVHHNDQRLSKAGSCVFVHLRTTPDATTAGCTAMNEQDMNNILSWLKADHHPVMVLLPVSVYNQKQQEWNLPKVITEK